MSQALKLPKLQKPHFQIVTLLEIIMKPSHEEIQFLLGNKIILHAQDLNQETELLKDIYNDMKLETERVY